MSTNKMPTNKAVLEIAAGALLEMISVLDKEKGGKDITKNEKAALNFLSKRLSEIGSEILSILMVHSMEVKSENKKPNKKK